MVFPEYSSAALTRLRFHTSRKTFFKVTVWPSSSRKVPVALCSRLCKSPLGPFVLGSQFFAQVLGLPKSSHVMALKIVVFPLAFRP